jgi:DNA-3-methyladenine glycosylase II
MSREAIRHLRRDPAMDALIRHVGRCGLAVDRGETPYQALMRAIAYQQLHANAARAMLARLAAHFPALAARFPEPADVLALPDGALRGCGFSATKAAALRDICAHALAGNVPTRRGAMRLTDAALIEQLTAIRGVGRWTVEMLLIFTLGRPDILPVDDYGVREGYRWLHGLEKQPTPRALAAMGEAWSPFRSYAAWYLWRGADAAKRGEDSPMAAKIRRRRVAPRAEV